MNKFILLVCFFSLCSLCKGSDSIENINQINISDKKTDWELVGIITTMSQNGEKKQFKLYYKTIGVKSFYQVREYIEVVGTVTGYNVVFGDYSLRGEKFNAKFSNGYVDYYFNLS